MGEICKLYIKKTKRKKKVHQILNLILRGAMLESWLWEIACFFCSICLFPNGIH